MERQVLGKDTGSSYSAGISVPAGRLVFISGTVALDDQGQVIGPGDKVPIIHKDKQKSPARMFSTLFFSLKEKANIVYI